MARRRPRHLRRVLVFLTSLAIHVGLFFVAISEFQFYPRPLESEPAVQVELVPQETVPPIPPISQPPKPEVTPQPTPPAPPPTPKPQPPQPAPTATQPVVAKPAPTPTAPIRTAPAPAPTPAPKPAPAPTPLAPPQPAPQPGPPQAVPQSAVTQTQQRVVAPRQLILHKSQQPASSLAPPVSIPGAVFASPPAPGGAAPGGAPGGAAPGGAGAQATPGLPGGKLPGFGTGLRGGVLGCINAEAVKLTAAERQHCDAAYGMGTETAPQMDRISASKRATLDQQAAQEAAAAKYRDSMPAGTDSTPEAGQPRVGHKPGE